MEKEIEEIQPIEAAPAKKESKKKRPRKNVRVLNFDELDRECQQATGLAGLFDGFRMDINKIVTNEFILTHIYAFGSAREPAGYQYSTTVTGSRYALNARFVPQQNAIFGKTHWKINKHLKVRVGFQSGYEPVSEQAVMMSMMQGGASPPPSLSSSYNFELDYIGSHHNFDVKVDHGQCIASYVQAFSRNLMCGVRAYYDIMGNTFGTFAGRLAQRSRSYASVWYMSYCTLGELAISYAQTRNRKTLASEVRVQRHPRTGFWTPVFSMGFNYSLLTASIAGRIDSNLLASMVFTEAMGSVAKLTMSILMDYKNDNYKVGCSVSIHY